MTIDGSDIFELPIFQSFFTYIVFACWDWLDDPNSPTTSEHLQLRQNIFSVHWMLIEQMSKWIKLNSSCTDIAVGLYIYDTFK